MNNGVNMAGSRILEIPSSILLLDVFLHHFLFTNLFSLMICLSHFDVCNQVSACASINDVRHRDYQVIERSSLRLFSRAQLWWRWRNGSLVTCKSLPNTQLITQPANQRIKKIKESPPLLQASCRSPVPDFCWWTSSEWEGSRRVSDPPPECRRWSPPYCITPPHYTSW